MKICFIPIDNRPVCYDLAKKIVAMDESIELIMPPKQLLGDLKQVAQIDEILSWLQIHSNVDCMVLSLDTLVYGGLIPSRRGVGGYLESFNELQERINKLKSLLRNKKVFAFSSIMRISNNNYNEEEKEYWSQYGTEIFKYSFEYHKAIKQNSNLPKTNIPKDILDDYLNTRKRNFEINKLYLEWQKEGIFDTLIFSKDDCAEYGFNVLEAEELATLGGFTKTGADEIPLSLLARCLDKKIKIFPQFVEPDYKNLISNYEDVSIEKSTLSQIELCGFELANSYNEADVILIVNNFIEKQGELVMNWDTELFNKIFTVPNKPYCIADVRFANGADNKFIKQLLPQIDLKNFNGYAGWNTSANTLGSLLASVKYKWNANKYNEKAFKKLQMVRFLDDWAYQANVRKEIVTTSDIKDLMKKYEDILFEVLQYKPEKNIEYIYPWNRKFEIEVIL